MARLLRSLGSWCARHGLVVIAIWALLGIGVGAAVTTFGAETNDDLTLPGTDSQAAKDLLEERFPPQQNGVNPIVFDVDDGQAHRRRRQAGGQRSRSRRSQAAPARLQRHRPAQQQRPDRGTAVRGRADRPSSPVLLDVGLRRPRRAELAQEVFDATAPGHATAGITRGRRRLARLARCRPTTTESSEVVGIVAAMVILTLVLGSLVAMGMPIITAVRRARRRPRRRRAARARGRHARRPAPTLATMIGLGVGIDYALFLVTRHQDAARATACRWRTSIAHAVATSGSAIVFAGQHRRHRPALAGRRRHPAGQRARPTRPRSRW